MKSIINLLLIVGLLLATTPDLMAQSYKFGHINSADLLATMPAAKSAEKELETFSTQLDNQYKTMLTTFQTDYQKVQSDVAGGILTPKQIEEKEQEFAGKQQELQKFEMEAQQKIQNKREELIGPILKNAEQAIKDVAAESGYSYIFDTSLGSGVLFAEPSEDIMSLVKTKLGL